MAESLLAVEHLHVGYGDLPVLRDVSFQLEESSSLAVLGSNGAGKTTIGRAISGIVPITLGSVRFAGVDITNTSAHRRRRAGLAYLPEGRGIFPGLTIRENLRLGFSPSRGQTEQEGLAKVAEVFPILMERSAQRAGSLSGGEQQMLSLARAMVANPKLMIIDEMSLGLAPKVVDAVFESLLRIRAMGCAVVLIEQFVHRALDFADECLIMSRGSITWSGPAADARGEVLEHYLGHV